MEIFDVYKDIAERTNGDIYVGVVGPVRAGKSTFITKFMEQLVVPNVASKAARVRMEDELPQSANGRAIMTTQPKFVPAEAAKIEIAENIAINVRLVDCVGYLVDGASGHMDGEAPRMVKTPWSDNEMTFTSAAEYGTRKVIATHSTIGVVMTTDGSIATEIPRSSYVDAEERVVGELKELKKPFIIVLNSTSPNSKETEKLARSLEQKYSNPVVALDVLNMSQSDIKNIFERVLMQFPLVDVEVKLSKWMQALPLENTLISSVNEFLLSATESMATMSDYTKLPESLILLDDSRFKALHVESVELGKGKVIYSLEVCPTLFYHALSEQVGMEITDEFALMSQIADLVHAKKEYDKIRRALDEVRETGYGVVSPSMEELQLEDPQIVRQGSRFGVRLKASAPSLHIMQVDIKTEVNPVVGTEQQSEEMVKYLLSEFENDPKGIWETNMFGKSLSSLVNENLNNKLTAMPENTQHKMRRTLSRIVNEGKGGVICILL
ncbi:MAG: stage IV sporulation protein A [Firmicutes bacterium]|nr:stage IV sporulation protein A [Bacillota bacterium]